jgi:hypothetical protein
MKPAPLALGLALIGFAAPAHAADGITIPQSGLLPELDYRCQTPIPPYKNYHVHVSFANKTMTVDGDETNSISISPSISEGGALNEFGNYVPARIIWSVVGYKGGKWFLFFHPASANFFHPNSLEAFCLINR